VAAENMMLLFFIIGKVCKDGEQQESYTKSGKEAKAVVALLSMFLASNHRRMIASTTTTTVTTPHRARRLFRVEIVVDAFFRITSLHFCWQLKNT
jgi:hypothetical protein